LEAARNGYARMAAADGPMAEQAMLQLAALDNSTGDYASAVAMLERMASKYRDSPLEAERRLAQGYALYKLGRFHEAEALLGQLRDHPSLDVEAYYWLGLCQTARSAWHDAADTLVAGGKLDSHHRLSPALAFQAGQALARDGQLESAKEQFDRVLTEWPQASCADACLLGKLRIAVEQHRYADCVSLADELAAKSPESPLLPQAQLAKGQSLVALDRHAEAVAPLEQLLNRKPAEQTPGEVRSEALAALAICNARLEHFEQSENNLRALRGQQPGGQLLANASAQVAELAGRAGQTKLAGELFAALAQDKDSRGVACRGLLALAWRHFEAEEWTSAADVCQRLLAQDANVELAAEAALLRGRSLEHLNQNDSALAMYTLVIDRYRASKHEAEALWRAARLHDSLRHSKEAIELYARLVDDHPDFGERDAALYRRAWLLGDLHQADVANEVFAQLRREYPASRYAADAALRLAESAIEARRFDQAQELVASITLPDAPPAIRQQALYLQGRAHMLEGQWSAAQASLTKLVETFPDSELALSAAYLIAESTFQQGQFEQALDRLNDLAQRTKERNEPWSAMVELRRAQALAHMKEWEKSLESAEAIGKRFPNFEQQYEVDYLIGRALAATADFSGAREAYARVIASPQGSKTATAAMAQWMIGESFFHQENYPAALAEYAKLDGRYPFPRWQAAALLQAGKCHERMGQWRSAAEAYDRLTKDFSASEFGEEVARRSDAVRAHLAAPTAKTK
jgi:TolA-binding protein